MTKIALVSASLLEYGASTACQLPRAVQDKDGDHPRMMRDHHPKHERTLHPSSVSSGNRPVANADNFMKSMKQPVTAKRPVLRSKSRQAKNPCGGPAWPRSSPDWEMKNMRREHRDMQGWNERHAYDAIPWTADGCERAELTQQFDQRLADTSAHQQAVFKACQGKANGTAVQVKVGTHSVNGTCEVRFQPNSTVQQNLHYKNDLKLKRCSSAPFLSSVKNKRFDYLCHSQSHTSIYTEYTPAFQLINLWLYSHQEKAPNARTQGKMLHDWAIEIRVIEDTFPSLFRIINAGTNQYWGKRYATIQSALRDMQFVLHELLNAEKHYATLPAFQETVSRELVDQISKLLQTSWRIS